MENYSQYKTLNSILYLLSKDAENDLHNIFKHLYVADRKHFAIYGRTITGESYKRLKYGPVPFPLYPAITKTYNPNSPLRNIRVTNSRISVTGDIELKYLSESDIECLDQALIALNGMSFEERTNYTHDNAYHNVRMRETINLLDMAKVENVSDDKLEYLKSILEIENIFNNA